MVLVRKTDRHLEVKVNILEYHDWKLYPADHIFPFLNYRFSDHVSQGVMLINTLGVILSLMVSTNFSQRSPVKHTLLEYHEMFVPDFYIKMYFGEHVTGT